MRLYCGDRPEFVSRPHLHGREGHRAAAGRCRLCEGRASAAGIPEAQFARPDSGARAWRRHGDHRERRDLPLSGGAAPEPAAVRHRRRQRAPRSRCGIGASSSRCSARSATWRCTRSSSSRTGSSSSRHSRRPQREAVPGNGRGSTANWPTAAPSLPATTSRSPTSPAASRLARRRSSEWRCRAIAVQRAPLARPRAGASELEAA